MRQMKRDLSWPTFWLGIVFIMTCLVLAVLEGCGGDAQDVGAATEPVIGGFPVPEGASPTVRVQKETGGGCSGIMILPDVALTAGHCAPVTFVAGVAASHTVVHPGYDFPKDDIALVFLSEPVPFPLAIIDQAALGPAWVEGYASGELETALVEIEVLLGRLILTAPGTADACQGDSGGPLFQGPDVVGLTSFGNTEMCGSGGGYVPLYRYIPWIQGEVGGPIRQRQHYVRHVPRSGCSAGGKISTGRGIAMFALLLFLLGIWRLYNAPL